LSFIAQLMQVSMSSGEEPLSTAHQDLRPTEC